MCPSTTTSFLTPSCWDRWYSHHSSSKHLRRTLPHQTYRRLFRRGFGAYQIQSLRWQGHSRQGTRGFPSVDSANREGACKSDGATTRVDIGGAERIRDCSLEGKHLTG